MKKSFLHLKTKGKLNSEYKIQKSNGHFCKKNRAPEKWLGWKK